MTRIDLDFARDALFSDIDGTLIDIAPTPEQVVVPRSLLQSLEALSPRLGGALAFCTGRTLAAADRLLAPLKLAAVGSHGAEIRTAPDAPVTDVAPPLPDKVRETFADVAAKLPGVRVEDKHFTLAFHYRLAMQHEAALFAILAQRMPGLGLQLVELRGKAIVELKSPAFNKGTGLRALMDRAPFKGRRPIYMGDDTTDEDVFMVLKDYGGLGISVGAPMKGAAKEFASPSAVRDWIARLATGEAT
ncbi:MAG TPA: trehalose-phosphatase [Rhizomicrobium sp.]|jgi:trehalose 6-phosphate phosphatase